MSCELCNLILELWNCKLGILIPELQAKLHPQAMSCVHPHPQAMSCDSSSLNHKLCILMTSASSSLNHTQQVRTSAKPQQ